jgi:putative ABC transport system ATP-binding protein
MIELNEVYKIYQMGDSEVRAVDGISLSIEKGEFVAIVGQSGSGKTTCMNIIGCLDVPTAGRYFLDGSDVSSLSDDELAGIRNKKIGFIFQQYNLIPKLNVLENVELPLLYSGMPSDERIKTAKAVLERVGLSDKMHHLPSQLSGGQQQRVSVARALSGSPSIILADEPTGALDSKTGHELLDFLKELNGDGNTIVLITHDKYRLKRGQAHRPDPGRKNRVRRGFRSHSKELTIWNSSSLFSWRSKASCRARQGPCSPCSAIIIGVAAVDRDRQPRPGHVEKYDRDVREHGNESDSGQSARPRQHAGHHAGRNL